MKHLPHKTFTAQSLNVQALMSMYRDLEDADDDKDRIMPIVVFMAFSIEAYLNSLGARCIPYWDELERLPWRKKISILHAAAEKQPDWGGKQLQFVCEVFNLRDKLAHGRPITIVGPAFDDHHSAVVFLAERNLQPEWFGRLTKAWALVAKENFTEFMKYLAALHGVHEVDHLVISTGGVRQEA